ncbi:hypothetical protein SPRG_01871 [Saprolegnia parasitica CBS 223.65]|uniref:STI1 domain-containing protein n=1 Tax=Saprolegnia parasitica (strain CBS 223.65) TaxID=695850 RepID=A0A067D2S6_SAPPC|nr:hypothetical protein SPRG_01871 [Saprolegnia parasitica CBS 223.65]KDO33056.1 hypothetical protein SPRG_01871 [Saprolegnia parasitica CBS 223.65]|eukprot:XP_012195827.1 hypothetical protein SPRG_01871 [Saprolegnia parasitica CBS 223.65]
MASIEQAGIFSALEYLASLAAKSNYDSENVEVGVQCLKEAFNVDPASASTKQALGLGQHQFADIFAAGCKALHITLEAATPIAPEDPVIAANPALWQKWVSKLEAKGFFAGVQKGTPEYNQLYQKALGKFKEKFDAKPTLSKEQKEAKAEELKASGNAALTAKDYAKAADLYKQAISFSADGPNSHIYYSNLGAAQMYLEEYEEVVASCEKAIAINPNYGKAYSRLGSAYIQLEDFDAAVDAYQRGLEVDPTNAACKAGLTEAKSKKQRLQPTTREAPAAGGMPGGMPDLSALAGLMGGAGGAGGLAGLMSNPAMQQMAAQMMQNPQMMSMAQNMMQNPAMMSQMMGAMGGGGGAGAGAGGMPDLSSMLTPEMMESFRTNPQVNAMRGDPVMADFFRDMDAGGPQAAMRHMSNPAVAAKLQTLLGGMM